MARSRALLSDGDLADGRFREAIEHLSRTRVRAELARAHLLYGEWLRREKRRGDARAQLRTAHGMLDTMGMAAFAERARRELLATGEMARGRATATVSALTAQETSIARLARDGRTNPEIGAPGPDLLRDQLGKPGPLRQCHHRDQPGPRHEIRVVKRCVRPGQAMQQSHLTGVLSNQATEALDTPIVPVQRAPFALTRLETPLFTRSDLTPARKSPCQPA